MAGGGGGSSSGGGGGGSGGGVGREGDWECSSCGNRNYAFRSFCNRCKQPRLLVDNKTPSDSKWLPRIGDWICTGCSNNNYASREKCKKCGQPKEVAALPATALPGAIPTHAHYFARVQGGMGLKLNHSEAFASLPNWPFGGADKFGHLPQSNLSYGGNNLSGYASNPHPFQLVEKGWRNGDWICNCGFHNYSSRTQCKKCNAAMPSGAPSAAVSSAQPTDFFPVLGKRLAPAEFINGWDSKRLNSGDLNNFLPNREQVPYGAFEPNNMGSNNEQASGLFGTRISENPMNSSLHMEMQPTPNQLMMIPAVLGKGAKQWRNGDWMCSSCNNHNYASRAQCNRCHGLRDPVLQPVNAI